MNLPFDNSGIYIDLWKTISQDLNDFREKKEAKEGIDSVDRSVRVVLKRYLKIFNIISKKVLPLSDFFNELESNREYHSRQLYVLRKTTKGDLIPILNPHVDSFNENNLEALDNILFQANQKLNEPYECIWILNHTMMFLADWEIKNNPGLFKEDFLTGIVAENVSSLPSNLRMLSRVIAKDKSKVLQMYPFSFLMNYSYFYPVHLYHTGKEPDGPVPAPAAPAPAASPEAPAPPGVPEAPVGPLGKDSESTRAIQEFYNKLYAAKNEYEAQSGSDEAKDKYKKAFDYLGLEEEKSIIFKDYKSVFDNKANLKKEQERLEKALVTNLNLLENSDTRKVLLHTTLSALDTSLHAKTHTPTND
jgi:hypothetical protein